MSIHGQSSVIRIHHSKILALFRTLDSVLIVFLLWALLRIADVPWQDIHTIVAFSAVVLFGYFAEGNEVYYLWRGHSTMHLSHRLFVSWLCSATVIGIPIVLFNFSGTENLYLLWAWLFLMPFCIIGSHLGRRLVLIKVRANSDEPRRVAIVGATELGLRLLKSMKGMPWLGYQVVGFYDDRIDTSNFERRLQGEQIDVQGGFEQLYADARDGKIDSVFIALPMRAELRMHSLMDHLADTTVSPYIIPDVFSFDLLHSRLTCLQGIPALSIYDSPLADNSWAKRLEDLFIGISMLAVLAIPMLIIAAGVKLTSKGPVFFKQTRYGMGGDKIKVWKFRSMTVTEDGENVKQAMRQDPRVTPFGNFLRRTSLDELPQLFNVISGSMSLVGPRPHAVAHNEFYRRQIKGYMLRHKVKPGMTGLAQINGFRGETDTLDKMSGRIAYDLEYIQHWSLALDLKILWLTPFRGFIGKNVY